jgi:hypothetical protein
MTKKHYSADDFFNSVDYPNIIDNIKGIYTSDGSINLLLDFERVLDEADLYAFKNWDLGELVDGPDTKKYTTACIFMYPEKLMPDPRGGKRLISLGCNILFKKTKIKVPIKIEDPSDYKAGTHYPKMTERTVWLVRIEIPKELMNDIREGSIDLAGQTLDLDELDTAYEQDLDKEGTEEDTDQMDGGQVDQGPMPGPQGAR